MTAYAYRIPSALEAMRDELRAEDRTLTEGKKSFARNFYATRQKWSLLHPEASDRQFILWYLDPGAYNGSFQNYLDAGLAQKQGFSVDLDWRFGELSAAGAALRDNVPPAVIRARREAGLSIRPPRRETTTIQIPTAHADAIRAARDLVSRTDNLNGPDALSRVVMSYAAQPDIIRDGLRGRDATGERLLPAMLDAVDDRRDYRTTLAHGGPCIVPDCPSTAVHLNHLRAEPDSRYRTTTLFCRVCERHHLARPGDTTDAYHGQTQDQWIERHFSSPADFWRRVALDLAAAAEATRPSKESA